MKKYFVVIFCSFLINFLLISLSAQQDEKHIKLPIYLSALPNLNDYNIFANGGWDGNWYIGYNVGWIERINISSSTYHDIVINKVYIGAKLGRAKTRQKEKRPVWEKESIPGDIYIAVSSSPSWMSDQRYFLVSTEDLPLESDFENALEGVGESRWFWKQVPLEQINFNGPNYIILWSPTNYMVSRDTAPILCGGWGTRDNELNTWINNEIQGCPPIDPSQSLKTPISVFEPAIAIKLVPEGTTQYISVKIV